MSAINNENFPRGGKRIINTNESIKRKREDALFTTENHSKAKKIRKAKATKEKISSEDSWKTSLKFSGTLTYNKMQDGMIILASVRHISNLALQIEFPGLTFGLITINRISEPFTTILTQKLQERDGEESCAALRNMFKIGQLIPAKILTVENTDRGHEVQVSTNPVDLYAERTHSSFKKGILLWACVISELDHGYEMSVGVKNCRVFLPFKNTDESKKYVVGELIYCIVHKAENTNIATTLTVSAKQEHIDKFQLTDDFNLHDLLPGTKVEFVVEEILLHGIKGQFLENCLGYLDETQIFSKVNLNKLTEGSTLSAYVLFVEPITKVTYLTLRGLETLPGPQHEVGKIITSEVISSVSKGLYLKLGKEGSGFVTNKRLVNTLPQNPDVDIIDAVRKKYPVGSRHPCRILDFNYMQQLHICTFEQKLIKEKIFSVKDLKIGQKVTVTVEKIQPSGLIVKTGHVQGFVPNLHLSNVKYSNAIKAKYSIGMSVNARVLNITHEENVLFTLKQGLVEVENCLIDKKDATPNSQHVGFVVQTKISGALVAFFGDIKGWISNRVLNSGNFERYADPREYFFLGQVVSVWIIGFKDEKLQVSLNYPGDIKRKNIKVGKQLGGTVTAIHNNSLDVQVGKHKIEGTIPLTHLAHNLSLCPTLLKTYEVGEELSNLMCIRNRDIPIMSIRESLAYDENQIKVPKFRDLKKGMLLRCSFEKKSGSGIYVSTPIVDYQEDIHILKKNVANGASHYLEKHELILARILNVNYNAKKLTLDANIGSDPHECVNDSLNLLIHNIEDLNRIINFGQRNSWELTQYKIGERVKCTIKEIGCEGDCWVILPNGIKGFIPKHLFLSNSKGYGVVEAVVLDYNFVNDYVEMCCKNDIKQKINKVQGADMKKSMSESSAVDILLFTQFYILGILKDSQCNRQLVYLPLLPSEIEETKYKEGDKVKIILKRRVADRIIGMPKKLIHILEQTSKTQKCKEKRKTEGVTKLTKQKIMEETVTEQCDNTDDDDSIMELDKNEEEVESTAESEGNEIGMDSEDEKNGVVSEDEKSGVELEEESGVESEDEKSGVELEEESGVESDEDMDVDENEADKSDNKNSKISIFHSNESSSGGAILSGINSFYASEDYSDSKDTDSSSDEESENKEQIKRKKKMTPKERAELAKIEEERISKIEKELADSTTTPQSAEQFDRLLLANPNSSELWLKYMAMHVATTELEKARTVAKRAIETINMTFVKEKFNIWLALLNLENMYGTKETFENVFNDAVKFNDSLEVYLSVIKLLASSGKLNEMEEKIKKIRSKEKQNSKMWLEIGQIYYSLGKFREARNIKEAALKSILDKRRQFDLIVRFGIMEFQSGDLEQAVANFETILDAYPSKVNIWIIYVDQLVKRNKIDSARKVLERAVGQKLAVKSMRAIFQKFITFEEQHGTSEAVEEVKRKAKDYVKSVSRK